MTGIAISYAAGILVFVLLADFGAMKSVLNALAVYPHLDKVAHFLMYGSLALVVNAALAMRPGWSLVRAIATGSIIVLIASTLDEYSNILVPQRGWSLADLAANCLGITCLGILPWFCSAVPMMRPGNIGQGEC
jgi:VanZ family protein